MSILRESDQFQFTTEPGKSLSTMDIHGAFKEATDKFKKRQAENPELIHWMTTYDIAMLPADVLFPLFDKALPNKVKAHDSHYGKYEPLTKWIGKNCNGMVTHVCLQFWFEDEREALMFKMMWG